MSKLEFQIYDYRETHQNFEDSDDESDTNDKLGEYTIQVFGRTMEGKSVYAKLRDFQPRFYIKVPDKWNKTECNRLTRWLTSKDNRKIYYRYKKALLKSMIIKRKKAYGFSNNKEFKFICFLFKNSFAMRKFADFFELNAIKIPGLVNRPRSFKVYESNLLPMLRCFHIQDIPGCGWVEASKYEIIDKEEQDSTCDLEIVLNYKNIKPIEKEVNAPLRILSFDIECDSCDGQFPQANRMKDNIIQIGSTYTYLGKSEPYRQHMVTLNSCDPIPDAIVESYEDERDLILAWIDEVKNSDADILTGYNIFYFDEKYIHDRAKMLGIDIDCAYFSKIKNHKCYFKEMKLASSALGENLLRFYDSPGLVHIDLMKDVQKTYKLESYKLDRVAANFINGEINEIKKLKNNKYKLICNQINDLHLEDYLHIELKESFVSEDIGEKFKVLKLDNKTNSIIIESEINLIEECNFSRGKIIWSQAKDDVPPKEIFALQHTTSAGRCKVAKYCLKDCRLVNLLINKLEVVTKNIEMANVCYVPFQYLFTRGQGIKLFSLCLKEYRKFGFLFPKMKALTDEEKEALGKYEGAIVFDPIPSVSYQAYAVKDYASLYPSSIIHKNMSHETKVDNDEYDNLPGVKYFNARFRNEQGKWEYRRFAKLENEFGVVPTILQTLLRERKAVKKQMKVTNDPFKYSILDAKQLALKVTANSLYGQLGASTSPIRERDVAACTTSTGREMLILAKKYDEEVLPYIMNGLENAIKNKDERTIIEIRKQYFKNPNDEKLFENIKLYLDNVKKYISVPIIRYGDSVIGNTPLLLKDISTNEIIIKKIKDLGSKWTNYHNDKESCELDNYQTWTEKGWTKIERVIRHKLDSSKKIIKIRTPSGIVFCTDEHSLLNKDGKEIDAKNIKLGEELLHSLPEELEVFNNENQFKRLIKRNKIIFNDSSKALEFYLNLKYNKYDNFQMKQEGNDYIFIKNNRKQKSFQSFENLNEVIEIMVDKRVDYVYDLTTDNHHFHAGVGSLIVHNTDSIFTNYNFIENYKTVNNKISLELFQKIIKFGKKLIMPFLPVNYREEFEDLYDKYYGNLEKLQFPTKLKWIPEPEHWKTIYDDTTLIKQFLKEYVEESYLPWLWTLQDIFHKDLSYLSDNVYQEILDIKIFKEGRHQVDKIGLDRIMVLNSEREEVKLPEIHPENRDRIIKDIETFIKEILKDYRIYPYFVFDNNQIKRRIKFLKGGNYITDKRSLTHSIKLGVLSGELVKQRLPFPHDLEYEKTFYPYLILTKKRYVGHKYEFDEDKYKFDYNGIVLKRRDNAPIVKEVCSGIIKKLIVERSPQEALDFARDTINKMFQDEFNIKYFLTSKTLKMKESYADWTRMGHVVLSERIGLRDPGNKPQAGDRISFAAIVVDNPKGKLQGDLIETPEYIKEKNLKIDYIFYLTNQIQKPALQFLALVNPKAHEMFESIKIREEQKRAGVPDIHDFFSEAKSLYDF